MNKLPLSIDYGKILPQAVEIEETVLGALLLEPDAISEVFDILKPESFYKDNHQKIFTAISQLYIDGKDVDVAIVTNELNKKGELDEIGGAYYLTKLMGHVASAAHVQTHAKIILNAYIQREIIRIGSELANIGYDNDNDPGELIDYANDQLAAINELSVSKKYDKHISVVLKKAKKELQAREANAKQNILNGVKTPLSSLDDMTNGWQTGLIIIAARPSMGKTQMMIKILKEAGLAGVPCLSFSLEMSDVSLGNRSITADGSINLRDYNKGLMKTETWAYVDKEIKNLEKLPIYIDDYSRANITYIKTQARLLHKKYGIKLIVIDYLTYIKIISKGRYDKYDELGKITKELKALAKELDIPIILLSQLNRKVEDSSDKRPRLSHLRESGNIEEDADMVIFIRRPEYYGVKEDDKGNSLVGVGELLIDKHRDGPIGSVKFRYDTGIRNIREYRENDMKEIQSHEAVVADIFGADNISDEDAPF